MQYCCWLKRIYFLPYKSYHRIFFFFLIHHCLKIHVWFTFGLLFVWQIVLIILWFTYMWAWHMVVMICHITNASLTTHEEGQC